MSGKWKAQIVSARDNVGSKRSHLDNKSQSDDQTLVLHGTGVPGKAVKIYDNGQLIGTVKVNNNGKWWFKTDTLDEGQHSFTAALVKSNGQLMQKSNKFDITIDTQADTLNKFQITENNNGHVIRGLAEKNAEVSVYDNGVLLGKTQANVKGQYKFVFEGEIAAGEHKISLTQEDLAGNTSAMGLEQTFTVENKQGSTLKAPTVNPGDYNGISFTLGGTVELSTGDQFSVSVNGNTYTLDDGIIIDGNTWQLAINAGGWSKGSYEVVATLSNGTQSIQDNSNNEITYDPNISIGQAGIDSDGDEIPDDIDIDDDNDGILDIIEGTGDLDRDGIINALDLDSDGDGIADNIEAQTTSDFKDPIVFVDMDGDGLNDIYDADRNNQDANASKGITAEDTDRDRYVDFLDKDSDNDGLLDIDESGVPFDDFSSNYQLLTGGYLPEDLADTFGTSERDYREANPISNKPIGPIKDIDSNFNQVLEGSPIGSSVGLTANAIDPDSKDTVSYELLDDAGGRFNIDATSGVVTLNQSLSYDTASEHKITVLAKSGDGSHSEKEFTIAVLEDNNPIGPVSDIDKRKNIVSETASTGSKVGITGFAEDPDAGDSVTYSLFDDAGGRFKINAQTGVVTLAKALDYDTAKSHQITIKAESSDQSVSAETFTIQVEKNDPIGPVSDINAKKNQVSESAAIGSKVGLTAKAIDPDAGDKVSYSLIDNAGGRFKIDKKTGVVTLAKDIDYDNGAAHNITVKAKSSDGTSSKETFTINILSDKPIGPIQDIDINNNEVSECSEAGSYVGITAKAVDPDTKGQITYKLIDDANGRFTIDSKTGEIFTAKELDYETHSHHDIKIEATSPDGTSTAKSMRIDVIDKETFIEFDSMPKHDVAIIHSNGNWDGYDLTVTVSGQSNLAEGTVIHIKQTYTQPQDAGYEFRTYTNYIEAEVQADGSFSAIAELPHYPDDKVYDYEGYDTYSQPDGHSIFTVESVEQLNGKQPCDLSSGHGRVDVQNSFLREVNSPLVLDLNNDGVTTVSLEQGVNFDIDGSGQKRATGWVSKEDAFLAFDRNGDGIINSDLELFGTNTELSDGSLAEDGFDALRDLDSNSDGVFDSSDERFDELLLWQDSNQNGISEADELSSLRDRGVAAINLEAQNILDFNNGNFHGLRSSWIDNEGNSHDIDDVWFRIGDYVDEPETTDIDAFLDASIGSPNTQENLMADSTQEKAEVLISEANVFDQGNELELALRNEDFSIQLL